jgi:NADPH-dependent glutamate synthase beta subunit-like oxidoreductase
MRPAAPGGADIANLLDRFERRIAATPPGMCPLAVQAAYLEACATQTCGKCVPCRDGLPQLATLARKVMMCEADDDDFEMMRMLATAIRDTADCAIGYDAAQAVIEGFKTFSEEYERHIADHACIDGIGQTLPCETLCPAHVDIPAYIAHVGAGDYAAAIETIRKDNPFPTACAFVCEHPCEQRCRRQIIDSPINIRGIKKFAVDQIATDKVPVPERLPDSGKKVAVIGAGPSGLTCAYYAALMGHKVTVFEMHDKLGGMMRYGIPSYRLPRERLDEDIRAVLSVGNIEVRTGARIDSASFAMIVEDYDAVYLSIGAHLGKKLGVDGVEAEGVLSAVELLAAVGDGEYPDFSGKKVAVVGGGNVAMDCARTALRAGADEVNIVYRRRKLDMPALDEEIESAMAEGIQLLELQAPARIEVDGDGRCVALVTQPQMIGPEKHGRPAPVPASKPEKRIPADVVLLAIGQDIDSNPFSVLEPDPRSKRFVVNDELRAMGFDNVFVGGDCQMGPSTVIKTIAAGKVAARNIDEYLGYHHKLPFDLIAPEPAQNNKVPTGRVNIAERPARERARDWLAVEEGMSLEEAIQECGRCLRCDHFGCGSLDEGRVQYV